MTGANPPSHAESITPFAPKSTSIFLVICHKKICKKMLTPRRDCAWPRARRGGGNETDSHLARPRTPTRTTWGIFKPKKNNA